MAETSKSFWGKFKKSKLSSAPFHDRLPTDLIEMFPSMEPAQLYHTYSSKCCKSISKTVEYLTRKQVSNYYDEIPINIIIESLNLSKNHTKKSQQQMSINKINYFQSTPTHILSHIFSFNSPMTLGKITRLNRECRLLSKSVLSKIIMYDFSYFYHNHLKKKKFNKIADDELRLISHINAFQYLHSLSLRSTFFTKWYFLSNITDKIKRNIKYLNLSCSINLYDDDIAIIIEEFINLEIFDISNCIELTDLSMTNIIELNGNNTLHTIYINNTPQITKYGLKQLVKYKKSIINIEWKGAKYGNISSCFVNAKHIQQLNLSSNQSLQELILSIADNNNNKNKNNKLKLDINLSNCKNLRFVNLNISYLTSLNLTQCMKLREVRCENTYKLINLNCKNCKFLQLLAIPSFTVEIIELRGCNLLNLELLFHCDNFLINSLSNNNLKSLDLSQINHISNDQIDMILDINQTNSFPLKAFSVYQCKLISISKIEFIDKTFQKPKTNSLRVQKRKQRIINRKNRRYC